MKPHTLWRHRDFLLLWTGQTISVFGSQFTHLAGALRQILEPPGPAA